MFRFDRLSYIYSFCLGIVMLSVTAASAVAAEKPEIFVQLGHASAVTAMAVSPDGRYLFSGGADNVMKQWDMVSGREMKTFKGHTEQINAIAISRDGKHVASAGRDDSIIIWDTETGRPVRTFRDGNSVEAVTFSPEGDVVTGNYSGRVKIWTIPTGSHRELTWDVSAPNSGVIGLKLLPAGKQLLIARKSGFKIMDIQANREERAFGTPSSIHGYAHAFSPDGRYALMGKTGGFTLWDVRTGKEIRKFGEGSSFCFSPDGKQILSGGGVDHTLRLWETETGKEVRKIYHPEGGYEGIYRVAFSVDGRQALAGYRDGTIKIWDVSGKGDNYQRILGGTTQSLMAMALSGDGRHALTGGEKGTIALWDLQAGKVLRTQKLENEISSLSFSPQGQDFIAGAGEDVTVWDTEKGTLRTTFKQPGDSILSVYAVAYAADGRYALSGGRGTVMVLDMKRMREVRVLPVKDTYVYSVAFSPDVRYAASGDLKGHLRLWDMRSGRNLWAVDHGSFNLYGLDFSPDGRTVVSGTVSYSAMGNPMNTLKLWDVARGRELGNFDAYKKSIYAARFSPDGRYLVTGGDELKLWNVATGREERTFEGHASGVKAVSFTGDGRYVLSAGWDSTMRIWEAASGKEVGQFISFLDGEWIVITPEGYYNASANGEKNLNVRVGNNVYGIESYREAFYRPDLVKVALSGGSLQEFRNIAAVRQPPTVDIVGTPARVSRAQVTVKLRLTDNGGGIGDIRLYLNDTAVIMDSRAVKVAGKDGKALSREYALQLSTGRNVIRAVAFNSDNTMQSNNAVHEVTASFAPAGKPSLSVLVIGINEFKNPKLRLNYPVADAELFAATLQAASAGLFDKINIRKLTTPEATTSTAIIREIKTFHSLRPDDLFVFYIASHGTVDEGEYFLITSNVGSLRTERLKADAISQHMLKDAIANIPATKKLIIIDTCNAGALGEAIQVAMLTRGMSEDTALKILSRAVGSTILSASTSVQEALEGYNGHGLFTYVLTEGLKGKADKGKTGYIKTTELADYVDSEVPALAEKVFKRAQYPTISISGQAFPIGKVK
ncbi:MAG: caspase family protein [Syntrophales bacterium]|nr:caspase family protein [Syntrophales bacterium]